jgi:membrane-bound lytic murein transglycosylase D
MRLFIIAIVFLFFILSYFADSGPMTDVDLVKASRYYPMNCSPVVHAFHLPEHVPALKGPLFSEHISSFKDEAKVECPSLLAGDASPVPVVSTREIAALYQKHGFNKAVQRNLDSFSRFKRSFSRRLVRSGRYVDVMSDIITEEGLPIELVYLPLIESAFKTDAYSHKHASGPWQIMPATAKILGLKTDWWIDERRDPIKSTRAAAKYLKYLFKKFDSWNLTLAAYNAGESRIRNAVRKVGSDDFWALRESRFIARETKNYVPSYIAATAIAMAPEEFGIKNLAYHSPLEYDEVVIDFPMSLDVIATLTGVTDRVIKDLNPELRRWCTPPDVSEYILRIPAGTTEMFSAGLGQTRVAELMNLKFYEVKSGDTVAKIAKRIGASVQKIIHMNGLGRKAMIFAGKSIVVPHDDNFKL